jgi:hypothetical protein
MNSFVFARIMYRSSWYMKRVIEPVQWIQGRGNPITKR